MVEKTGWRTMQAGRFQRFGFVAVITICLVLWPAREAAGFGTTRPELTGHSDADAAARLSRGFHQILDFFAQRDFSLLAAWREMRASGDPAFFEKRYPEISRQLDSWVGTIEIELGVPAETGSGMDFTFLLTELGPVARDPRATDIMRDNALATLSMICVMDGLRCDAGEFHRLMAGIVAGDPSPLRKTEAMRWSRRAGAPIDEDLLEKTLASPAARDIDLRAEIARDLISVPTPRSLSAQRLLISTSGLPADPRGDSARISCAVIERLAQARYAAASPDLIWALSDPSREVRACAASALVTLSERDFGFDAETEGPGNLEAIARWRAWWKDREDATR